MSSKTDTDADHIGQLTSINTGQDTHDGNNKKQNNNPQKGKANTSGNSGTGFCSDTEKMCRYVFEVPPRNSQMSDTLDVLKRYVQSNYKSAPLMCTLFAIKKQANRTSCQEETSQPTLRSYQLAHLRPRVEIPFSLISTKKSTKRQ